ncbi:MAG: hypothetical protein QXO16_03900 [Archaeoglobaceae archaeon]
MLREEIDEKRISEVFKRVNEGLRELANIGQNEPVGTIKLLHVFAPHYFPLIDRKIAIAFHLLRNEQDRLTCEVYLRWMKAIRKWLINYEDKIPELENAHNSLILKLIDECLYLMSSVDQKSRVKKLGLRFEGVIG